MTTTADLSRIRRAIRAFDFKSLFIEELGWDRFNVPPLSITISSETFTLQPVAQKRGVAVLLCTPNAHSGIPDYETRKKIDTEVAKQFHEHFIIYVDAGNTRQIWQWVKRQPGKPAANREATYHLGQTGEPLAQRLSQLYVDLLEDDSLNVAEMAERARSAFDVDKVTKKFYDRFQSEHERFVQDISGISISDDRVWYASLMLNRLMFSYFIQKKGFLNGDMHYLRTKLKQMRARFGSDQFHTFYREFLLHLFHDGLGTPEGSRSPAIRALIGDIPYLNGGLFEKHQIERDNTAIAIPDAAFERIFDFFDDFSWHLDDRPMRDDKEINPDVLGYIFEKYINQKQMGAYYTKEDITGYIGKNTILPFLFEAARKECRIAFEPSGEVWRLLRDDPDRYIYEAVRKGVDLDLPVEIAAGISAVSQRGGWNRPAADGYALLTETWREHIARRTRCLDLRAKLANGEIHEINDLITYNLDIVQFAQDVIERCEGPELLRAIWKALSTLTVLDPTCGSGAFLFAALRLLEPLYEASLLRMQAFVTDFDREGHTQRGPDFREVLARVKEHRVDERDENGNYRYFIRKEIILNNLYGVDIMEEAVEIAKLRLFLTLVSQVESSRSLEPLPDIDFNLRAGNTLVGFATFKEAEAAVSGNMFWFQQMPEIKQDAEELAALFKLFRQQQMTHGGHITNVDKQNLRDRLAALGATLDRFLAAEYGIDEHHVKDQAEREAKLAEWRKSHQPFHWFVEFYAIVHERGGFDVIIGNPPYVELHAVKGYKVLGYTTLPCGNLYPLVIERSMMLASSQGRVGFIVPVSSISTGGYGTLQKLLAKYSAHFSSYNDRPSRLFDGLEHIRLTIQLIQKSQTSNQTAYSTECYKWSAVERPFLFMRLQYQATEERYLPDSLPKISSSVETSILDKMWADRQSLEEQVSASGSAKLYYSRKMGGFLQVLDFVPDMYDGQGAKRLPSELKELRFTATNQAMASLCLLNSTLFRWFVNVFSDFRNLNRREVIGIHLNFASIIDEHGRELMELGGRLSRRLNESSEMRTMSFKGDVLRVQCIIPKYSKPIIDEIDRVLAQHYGFTDEELDFIINYDIKYRMGADNGESGENSDAEE